jgi:hypothetical protein
MIPSGPLLFAILPDLFLQVCRKTPASLVPDEEPMQLEKEWGIDAAEGHTEIFSV